MPAPDQSITTLDTLVTRLRESHEISAYQAIDRLVQAGESVGLNIEDLVQMVDRGRTFEALLELIQSRMEVSRRAA